MTAFSQPERRGLERMQVLKPDPHPDADLLTAFAEHSLTAREQEQILGHLAACAGCRDVIALAGTPLVEPVPEPVRRRAFWEMPLLRWGAVAATAVIVVGAVTIGVREHQIPHAAFMTKEAPPVAGADQDSLPTTVASPSGEELPAATPPATKKRAPHLQQELRFERPASAPQDVKTKVVNTKDVNTKDAQTKKAEQPISIAGIGSQVAAAPAVSPKDARASGSGVNNYSMTVPPSPPSRDTNGNVDKAFSASPNLPVNGRNAAGLGAVPAQRVGANAPPAAAKTQATANAQSSYAANASPADETALAQNQSVEINDALVPQAPSQPAEMMNKVQSRAQPGLFHEVRPIESVITGTEWQITPQGELQRSFSRGNYWETMLKGRQFRSVAVVRDHIWTGGDDGALYFSSDNGRTWNPMPVHDANSSVMGNVVRLRFDDAQNGSLDTSTGETWKTNDGGQSWHKQQ